MRNESSLPPEPRQFWQFENSAGDEEATLYVYGDIVTYDLENWNWPDDVVPNKFKNELKALGNVRTINVRINSNGGSVFAAYAIMNLLKSHSAQIVVHIDGIAASAATIIAMAGDKIITALGSIWMIHLPSLTLWDSYNANDLNKLVNTLTTITQSITDIYNARTGIDKAVLEQMMTEETWMTGSEALEKGFADEVTEVDVATYLSADNKTAVFNDLKMDISKIRNKDKLLSMLSTVRPVHSAEQQPQQTPQSKNNKEQEESIMNLEELKAKYPSIYEDAFKEGVAQGIKDERARIQSIDNMALPGTETLTNKAKYETGITAEQYAVELIMAQKQQGLKFKNDAVDDAVSLKEVPAAPSSPTAADDEELALLAKAGERAKNIRR